MSKIETDQKNDVLECYSGNTWTKEIEELFPSDVQGCINYGYWEKVPNKITKKERLESQLQLYRKLFHFIDLNKKDSQKILEIGCGRGHGIYLLHQNGQQAYGIDLVQEQIGTCQKNYPLLKDYFRQGSASQTKFEAQSFDRIISLEAAQHFDSFKDFAQESYRILKSQGKIALSTFFFPNSNARIEIQSIIPKGVEGTHHAITIEKAKFDLMEAGFINIQILPIGNKVFKGFSNWAAQEMTIPNHTPLWIDAYHKNLIDYYMIKGEKI